MHCYGEWAKERQSQRQKSLFFQFIPQLASLVKTGPVTSQEPGILYWSETARTAMELIWNTSIVGSDNISARPTPTQDF